MKDAIAGILLLISLAALIPGVVTLIDPKSFKLRTRCDAVPILTAWIAGFGCVFFVAPTEDVGIAWSLGLTFIVIWGGLFRWSWLKSTKMRAQQGGDGRLNPARTPRSDTRPRPAMPKRFLQWVQACLNPLQTKRRKA